MSRERNTQELLKETDREQSPVTWPETTLNSGRAIDAFLRKGDPNATPIQRLGLVVYALMFLFLFAIFVGLIIGIVVKHEFDWPTFLALLMMGTLTGIFGFRFLFNVLRRQNTTKCNANFLP